MTNFQRIRENISNDKYSENPHFRHSKLTQSAECQISASRSLRRLKSHRHHIFILPYCQLSQCHFGNYHYIVILPYHICDDQAFKLFDADGDGKINGEELKALVNKVSDDDDDDAADNKDGDYYYHNHRHPMLRKNRRFSECMWCLLIKE